MLLSYVNTRKQNIIFYCLVLVGAWFLMWPAFVNGFPFVGPDTATYIFSGFKPETPFDRPIAYGLFIRIASINGWSLMGVIFLQAYLVSYLVQRLCANFYKNNFGFFIVIALSLLSPLSLLVCQLYADVFTAIGILSIVTILTENRRKTGIWLYLLFFFAVATHMSHVLLFSVIIFFIFLFRKKFKHKVEFAIINRRIIILLLLTAAGIATMGSALAKSKHVFFMGALVEHGILKQFLDDNCSTNHYKLCSYKDDLPRTNNEFLWADYSPLYKMGGWFENKAEYQEIIFKTLTTPKYIKMHIIASVKATGQQLLVNNISFVDISNPRVAYVHDCIALYMPRQATIMAAAKQNKPHFLSGLFQLSVLYNIVAVLASIIIIGTLLFKRVILSANVSFFMFVCFISILVNAWDCGTFSSVDPRYGSRTVWLILFCGLLCCFGLMKKRQSKSV